MLFLYYNTIGTQHGRLSRQCFSTLIYILKLFPYSKKGNYNSLTLDRQPVEIRRKFPSRKKTPKVTQWGVTLPKIIVTVPLTLLLIDGDTECLEVIKPRVLYHPPTREKQHLCTRKGELKLGSVIRIKQLLDSSSSPKIPYTINTSSSSKPPDECPHG